MFSIIVEDCAGGGSDDDGDGVGGGGGGGVVDGRGGCSWRRKCSKHPEMTFLSTLILAVLGCGMCCPTFVCPAARPGLPATCQGLQTGDTTIQQSTPTHRLDHRLDHSHQGTRYVGGRWMF